MIVTLRQRGWSWFEWWTQLPEFIHTTIQVKVSFRCLFPVPLIELHSSFWTIDLIYVFSILERSLRNDTILRKCSYFVSFTSFSLLHFISRVTRTFSLHVMHLRFTLRSHAIERPIQCNMSSDEVRRRLLNLGKIEGKNGITFFSSILFALVTSLCLGGRWSDVMITMNTHSSFTVPSILFVIRDWNSHNSIGSAALRPLVIGVIVVIMVKRKWWHLKPTILEVMDF